MEKTDKERFELAREIIRHENDLANHRMTWMFVLQGFLFTAFAAGIGLLDKFKHDDLARGCLLVGLITLGFLGLVSGFTASNLIGIHYEQIEDVKKWCGKIEGFPTLAGSLGDNWYNQTFTAKNLPLFLAASWAVLVGLLILGVGRCYGAVALVLL